MPYRPQPGERRGGRILVRKHRKRRGRGEREGGSRDKEQEKRKGRDVVKNKQKKRRGGGWVGWGALQDRKEETEELHLAKIKRQFGARWDNQFQAVNWEHWEGRR